MPSRSDRVRSEDEVVTHPTAKLGIVEQQRKETRFELLAQLCDPREQLRLASFLHAEGAQLLALVAVVEDGEEFVVGVQRSSARVGSAVIEEGIRDPVECRTRRSRVRIPPPLLKKALKPRRPSNRGFVLRAAGWFDPIDASDHRRARAGSKPVPRRLL